MSETGLLAVEMRAGGVLRVRIDRPQVSFARTWADPEHWAAVERKAAKA